MLDPDTNGGYPYNYNNSTSYFTNRTDDRIAHGRSNLQNWKEEEEEEEGDPFRAKPVRSEEEAVSGASTPPLWSSPGTRHHLGHRNMSPNSRVQAIASGQRELMEMVSRMPEGSYELSLKDMVEHQLPATVVESNQETTISNCKVVPRRDHQKGAAGSINGRSAFSTRSSVVRLDQDKKKKKKKPAVVRSRSGSFDNGGAPFLKMLFPVSFGSTKKGRLRSNSMGKASGGGGGFVDGRVSPRPLLFGEEERSRDGDRDWCKKGDEEEEEGAGVESLGFSSSGKSGSSKSTGHSTSRSSSRNSTRHASFSCWSCIFSNRGKKRAA